MRGSAPLLNVLDSRDFYQSSKKKINFRSPACMKSKYLCQSVVNMRITISKLSDSYNVFVSAMSLLPCFLVA